MQQLLEDDVPVFSLGVANDATLLVREVRRGAFRRPTWKGTQHTTQSCMCWDLGEGAPNNFASVLRGFAFIVLNSSPRILSLTGFGVRVWMAGWRGARAVKKVADSPVKGHDDHLGMFDVSNQCLLALTYLLPAMCLPLFDHMLVFV
jgi:hypothetical protein